MGVRRLLDQFRVPGVQQVMLQVKIAEVNRSALRRMGASLLYQDATGRTFGSTVGSSLPATSQGGNLLGLAFYFSQRTWGWITLDPLTYYLSVAPVILTVSEVLLISFIILN